MPATIASRARRAARKLCERLDGLRFAAPVSHVYNPLEYARRAHDAYLRRYGNDRKRVIALGMNPGPFGMAQTGVPFGDVRCVRDWLGIDERVGRPAREHPRRPVRGFACTRSEISGSRLWRAIADEYATPERFFEGRFIANYCPLLFLEASGRNRTPDKLPARERERLFARCDDHLRELVEIFEAEWVVGIGRFAELRAREALAGRGIRIGGILHPSPASPLANRDWRADARAKLVELGLCERRRGVQVRLECARGNSIDGGLA
ncbi:MAG TPA: uracil-DNA glycosylase family protein [Myxococcota bacterium]|nr:uracil-DNA glycosylase family protein [Myxococcota bacterium]